LAVALFPILITFLSPPQHLVFVSLSKLPFKGPMKRTAGRARSGSSSSNETRREAEARGSGIFNGLKICIINAKLKPETIGELSDLAENKGARLVAADNADIVITEIGAKQRLERHMTWEAAVSRTCFGIDVFANLRSTL